MADSKIIVPFIQSWEGGFVNDPDDKGGATNKGVTIGTFRQFFGSHKTVDDLKNITDEQWHQIFKKGFWDKCKADEIKSQSVANLIVDWAYNSGPGNAVPRVQRIAGVTADGIIGPKTLAAINGICPTVLFDKIHNDREQYYRTRSNAWKYLNGWLNRNNSVGFGWLILNDKAKTKIIFKD